MKKQSHNATVEIARIKKVASVTEHIYEITLQSPMIARTVKPGQFVHVRIDSTFQPFLRRPLSVGPCDEDDLTLIFVVRGRGTAALAGMKPGDLLDLIGPLGSPFELPEPGKVAILVAGGIGVVPLLLLNEIIPHEQPRHFILGVRSSDHLPVSDRKIKQHSILLASDDGSCGFEGNSIDLLNRMMKTIDPALAAIFGCGPFPMLKALKSYCTSHSITGQVSLEASMGCGVGACQGCAVPRPGGTGYLLACSDGPVVDMADVDFNSEFTP